MGTLEPNLSVRSVRFSPQTRSGLALPRQVSLPKAGTVETGRTKLSRWHTELIGMDGYYFTHKESFSFSWKLAFLTIFTLYYSLKLVKDRSLRLSDRWNDVCSTRKQHTCLAYIENLVALRAIFAAYVGHPHRTRTMVTSFCSKHEAEKAQRSEWLFINQSNRRCSESKALAERQTVRHNPPFWLFDKWVL